MRGFFFYRHSQYTAVSIPSASIARIVDSEGRCKAMYFRKANRVPGESQEQTPKRPSPAGQASALGSATTVEQIVPGLSTEEQVIYAGRFPCLSVNTFLVCFKVG